MPYDDQTELFYLVDKNDKVLGFTARKQAHKDRSKIHRSVDVVATNSSKQILLQKRSKHKDTFPGFWTISASGHVTYGQTYEQAAKREIEEELGIHPPLRYVAKELYDMGIEQEYSTIYSTSIEETPTNFDKTEIDEVRWVDIDSLAEFLKIEDVTPGCRGVLKTLGYVD
ncbi:MAG: hypothetical protein AUJ41_02990 [Candidatus Pacebacteria bacterium CG1_02_43_31]|nr:MAG: hypothetical protein AUJ41_02990 [Candidatus Pacebacteria bacterium CG1_02_43_31]